MNDFEKTGFLVVKNFCLAETAGLLAEELLLYREVAGAKAGVFFHDPIVEGDIFSLFASHDAALRFWQPKISALISTPLELINSFARIYATGSVLKSHRDHVYLEISLTLCLKRDEPDWPFCIRGLDGIEREIVQDVGDAVIYKGKLHHWRKGPFLGKEQAQLFLHYADTRGPYAVSHKFCGRNQLAVPFQYKKSFFHQLRNKIFSKLRRLKKKYLT